MGGTFDPIHHGHLVAASEVAARFGLAEVIFVPTGQPWQKTDREVSPAEHRSLMTVIATASNPRFWVSRVDIDRPGPTFTIDTIRDIHELRPDAELYFITGADALGQILSWRDHHEMVRLARLVGVTRPGYELSDAHLPNDTVTLVDVPPWPSRPARADNGYATNCRSGTSSRMASFNTSASIASTALTWALRSWARRLPPWPLPNMRSILP